MASTSGEKLLARCAELHEAGALITYRRLADDLGWTIDRVMRRAGQLALSGELPHPIASRSHRPVPGCGYRKMLEAAAAIEAEGIEVTYAELARRLGCTAEKARSQVGNARQAGHPIEVKKSYPKRDGDRGEAAHGPGARAGEMDVQALEEIRAAKQAGLGGRARVEVKACKVHARRRPAR